MCILIGRQILKINSRQMSKTRTKLRQTKPASNTLQGDKIRIQSCSSHFFSVYINTNLENSCLYVFACSLFFLLFFFLKLLPFVLNIA